MTTEPSLAFQQAIRERLVTTPAVLALVSADRIIDGAARPENFPCIIIGDGQTVLEGHYPGWRNVTVYCDLHIWALEAGLAAVKTIGNEVWTAIGQTLDVPGYLLTDGVHTTGARYLRDPTEKHGHAILSVKALMGGEFGE